MKVTITAQATVEVSPAEHQLLAGAKPGALVQAIARANAFEAAITGVKETAAEVRAREEQERLDAEAAQLGNEADID